MHRHSLLLLLPLLCMLSCTKPYSTTTEALYERGEYGTPAPRAEARTQPAVDAAPQSYESRPPAAPQAYDDYSSARPETYQSAPDQLTPRSSAPRGLQLLSGTWRNTVEPDETVRFDFDHYTSFFEGNPIVEERIEYHEVCNTQCSAAGSVSYPCFIIRSQYATDCFGIVSVTDEQLQISQLGVSSGVVTYQKVRP
ncbi:MAG: hypothetical protein WBA17_16885 [Saprospiraceae bacterium]